MKNFIRGKVLFTVLALTPFWGAHGQDLPVAAFESMAAVEALDLPPPAQSSTAIEGVLSPLFFRAKSLSFNLGPRLVVLHRSSPVSETNWSGRSRKGDSEGTFTYYKGVTVGTLREGSRVWELRPSSRSGITLIYQVDTAQLPAEAPLRRPPGF